MTQRTLTIHSNSLTGRAHIVLLFGTANELLIYTLLGIP